VVGDVPENPLTSLSLSSVVIRATNAAIRASLPSALAARGAVPVSPAVAQFGWQANRLAAARRPYLALLDFFIFFKVLILFQVLGC
jgi:hypothetical protein